MRTSRTASVHFNASTIGRGLTLFGMKALRLTLRLLAVRAQIIIGHPLERNG